MTFPFLYYITVRVCSNMLAPIIPMLALLISGTYATNVIISNARSDDPYYSITYDGNDINALNDGAAFLEPGKQYTFKNTDSDNNGFCTHPFEILGTTINCDNSALVTIPIGTCNVTWRCTLHSYMTGTIKINKPGCPGVPDSKVCGIDDLVSRVEDAMPESNCLKDIMGPQVCVKTCGHLQALGQYVLNEWDKNSAKYETCNRTGYKLLATITDTNTISQDFAEMLNLKTDCQDSQDGKPIRDCDGGFGTCQADCTQTYSITGPAINGGAACAHTAGDTQRCTGGQCVPVDCDGGFGTCQADCTQTYSITGPAINGGAACNYTVGDTQPCTGGQCEEWRKRRDKGAFCCKAMIASCEACQAGLSVQQFCNITANKDVYGCCKVRNDCTNVCMPDMPDMNTCPDGTLLSRDEDCKFPACPVKTCHGDCMTWFDGCNTCKCENGTKTMCTRKWCARYEQAKCMDEDEPEDEKNCNTREVWTAEKKKWCCENKDLGCAPRIQCPRDCSSWYDGCNTCTCKYGFLGACTERFCFRKTEPKCLDDQCPRDCSSWYDGCNTCRCENGQITACTKRACLVKRPAKCLDCVDGDCQVGYEVVGADKRGCGGKCVPNCRTREVWTDENKDWCCVHKQIGCRYNCKTKEAWSAEKRQWCCRNQRLGCCPVVRCASPKPGCTRTWVDDINDFGCALYPCGKDECPQETRSKKKPQISIKDSRGVDRLRVTAEEDNDDTKVTLQIMDTKGRPRVSLGAQKISMKETNDIVRRRNIVRAIVDAAEGSAMNVSEAGLSEEMVEHLKERKVTDVVFAKARAKSKTNPTDCSEADINLVRDGNNTMAFEIVLNKTGDQSFKCYNGKPLSLLTLKTKNEDTQNEYEAHCWSESAWKKKGTYKEKGQYNCSRLSKYTNFIATDLGVMSVSMVEEESALECESNSDCGSHSDEYCGYSCIDNKCTEWCEVPAPSPDTPAPSPDTPAPSPDTPAPSPDTPAPSPDTPAPSPDTPAPSPDTSDPEVPAPSPDTPAPSPDTPEPDPDVTFGPGVPKIEACSEDSVTVLWEGTHNLVETESAECDSNVTETWLTWDERETTGYKKTFHNLGGQYRGQTRYFQCSVHCGENKARFEVHCPLIVDPDRPVTVNTSGSNLEIPAMIVAVSVGALLAILLAFIMCPRPKKPANNQPDKSQYHALSQEEEEEQAELKPLKWIP